MGKQGGYWAFWVMSLTLSACATQNATKPVPNLSSANLDRPDQLAPIKLAKGECGLFVWAGQNRRFIMFSKGQNHAVMSDPDGEIPLLATNPAAEPDYHGQYPTQSFIDTRGKAYDLSFNKVATMGHSIRYSQGSWRSEDDSGWERIEAAYGLSTCIPDGDLPMEDTLSASRFDLLRPLGQGGTTEPVQTARMTFTPASIRKETTKVLSLPAVTKIERPVVPALPAPPPIKTVKKAVAIPPRPQKPDVKKPAISPPPQSSQTGSYRIQLASFLSEKKAHMGWTKLTESYPALADLKPHIFPVQIPDKGLYFRLQIGPYDTKSVAARYCETLKDKGLDCFVTLQKF